MIDYVRPPLIIEKFLDGDGEVIPYGSRWVEMDQDGPEETYSVTTHPERFQPLVDVAHAIVEHLVETYDVHRDDSDEQTVVVRPFQTDAAAITFAFKPFPSVEVTAGSSTRLDETCGCDHCDEGVLDLIDELEEAVSAVVAGRLTEWPSGHELRHPNGERWKSGGTETSDPNQMKGDPVRYAAWVLRSR